ncbi:MAG: hypothetical protein ACK5D7_07680, partial [Planctomycetota bacterium]
MRCKKGLSGKAGGQTIWKEKVSGKEKVCGIDSEEKAYRFLMPFPPPAIGFIAISGNPNRRVGQA